ncbi:MAG: 23S rRNA (guanosine(2251)-2'-O)-methyltransferase RlmB [Clostridia bacterium]|jgi:23S rRNA (guanosine2251-2'-O)-methyltransferase
MGEAERETGLKEENPYLIEGRNPIREALKADRPLDKILVARGVWDGSVRQIIGIAKERRIVVQEVDRSRLDEISASGNHQGLIAYGAAHEYVDLEDILEGARAKGEDPFLIILDGISDPHNLGSILRTAECCGAHGVVIPKRRAVGLTPTVAKASSGAVEYIPVARVTNIAGALESLKKQGIWIVGADVTGELYYRADLTGPLALVIGSEGEGMSRLVREKCDFLVSIPLRGKIESLNASVAAGILMYEITKRRIGKITR